MSTVFWTVLLQGLTESSLCFLFRFSAAWEYILNLSKEEYSDKMILAITCTDKEREQSYGIIVAVNQSCCFSP